MSEKEKLNLLEELFEVDEGTLEPQMELAEIESYDSMAKLSLIVMFEDECGVKLTSDVIKSFRTIGDILQKMS